MAGDQPDRWLLLLPGAFGLALVCFAEAIGPSRAFAAEHKYAFDANQEWLGVGASNLGAGLFQGFPIGASLSKSAANDQAGAHSQMSGVIAAVLTALVALFFTQLFYPLPEATLGVIVIVAVSHMVKVKEMPRRSVSSRRISPEEHRRAPTPAARHLLSLLGVHHVAGWLALG